VVENIRKH